MASDHAVIVVGFCLVQRDFVQARLENRPDIGNAPASGVSRPVAGRIQSVSAVFSLHVEQSQAGTVSLLRVLLAINQLLSKQQDVMKEINA